MTPRKYSSSLFLAAYDSRRHKISTQEQKKTQKFIIYRKKSVECLKWEWTNEGRRVGEMKKLKDSTFDDFDDVDERWGGESKVSTRKAHQRRNYS